MIQLWHVTHILRSTVPDPRFGKGWVGALAHLWRIDSEGITSLIAHLLAEDVHDVPPVCVWRSGHIRDGHRRVAAAVALNLVVPVHICEDTGCIQPDCPLGPKAPKTGTQPTDTVDVSGTKEGTNR